ncbi:MAG: hypothetical protein V4727_06070 [Verrucomicrobiota bacterium]
MAQSASKAMQGALLSPNSSVGSAAEAFVPWSYVGWHGNSDEYDMKDSLAPKKSLLRKASLAVIPTLAAIVSLFLIQISSADDKPYRGSIELSGMYKIISSTDPLFPTSASKEWFLDFGNGTQSGANSGKVAVSVRENPKVTVLIMVWQYFPQNGTLLIGNQYEEGSRKAVARGAWVIDTESSGILLARSNCSVVLHRADPSDY